MVQPVDIGFQKVAVVGFGLIGASFAAAFREAYPQADLLAVDVDSQTLEKALEKGWATHVAQPCEDEFETFVTQGCDLVVLAAPITVMEGYLKQLSAWNYRGIITDTISTKTRIVALAEEHLSCPEHFVPGHPMAGSEKNGIDGARGDLFKGAHWILCPDANTPVEFFPRLHELVTTLGARVVVLPREEHDEAMAVVSHVPHVLASSLMTLAARHADDKQTLMRLAAGGFKDTTRIAAGSPELWCGIAFDNKEALRSGLKEMEEIISRFERALANDDRAGLTDLLADAAQARRALPAAWIPSTERLLEVRIPMLNRPGIVAEVTTITSSVGCNIQSIEIDHVTEDTAVLSLVLTDEGDVGQLSSRLINAGFSLSFSPLVPKEHIHVS